MKWEELPLADRAQLMAAAVRNGYTDIRSIKAAYANFQNQRQQTGNRYDKGGEFEVVNPLYDVPVDDQEERYQYFRSTLPENLQDDTIYRLRRAWELNGEPRVFSDAIAGDNPMFSYNIDDELYHGNSVAYNPDTDEYEFLKPVDHDTVDLELMQYFNNPELEQLRQNYQMDWDEDGSRGYYKYVPRTDDNTLAYGGNLFKTGGNKQSKKDYYRQQLIIRGLRGAQLEAVLANMEVESGFNPKAYNKSSGAQGLMQWLGSRKPKSWSEKDQLDYIAATYNKFGGNEWLDKKAWKRFNETTDPAEAARLFRRYWERPERSSWNATDALFKNSKGSYLPQEVNDLVAQVSNLQYNDPKAPVFTEEDQRLLDTPALAFYNPEYENPQAPDYKPSVLRESIKLDENLWRNPANRWELYNQFANMQQGSSQDDPLGWMTMMASLSPKTTPEQKEAASTMYQLFAPQDGDYMYHGLNFAAYGGGINRFDNGGRTITIGELPEAYVRAHGNMPVVTPAGNRTTLSDAYKNYNQTPVNTKDVPGLTDYLITQDQPDIATAREVELAQQHRANERFNNQVDNAAFALMSAPLLVPAVANPLTTLAGIGGGLMGQYTENKMISNLSKGKYNNWHDIVDSWDGVIGNMNNAERFYSNMFDPGMFTVGMAAGYPVSLYEKPIPDVYSAVKTFANEYNPQEVPKGFWKNTIKDLISLNRSVINAVNEERYPLNSAIFKRTANALHSAATDAKIKSIDLIAERLKASPDRNRNISDYQIDKSATVAKGRDIFIEPNYQKLYSNTNGVVTYDTGEPVIHYPLFVSENSNIMHNPLQWRLGSRTIYHEPVHVAQHDMYPVAFESGNATVYDQNRGNWYLNKDFVAYDAAKQLGGYPLKNKKVDYNGDVSSPTKNIPWERHHWEFDAVSQAYRMRHNMPSRISELSDQQIKGLVDHLYQRFGSDKDGLTRHVIEDIIYKNDAHGLAAGGKIKSGPK